MGGYGLRASSTKWLHVQRQGKLQINDMKQFWSCSWAAFVLKLLNLSKTPSFHEPLKAVIIVKAQIEPEQHLLLKDAHPTRWALILSYQ